MKNLIAKNIIILPTDKPSRLYLKNGGFTTNKSAGIDCFISVYKPQNIYITSDETIKEGDWVFDSTNYGLIHKVWEVTETHFSFKDSLHARGLKSTNKNLKTHFKKIILTTDQDLIKNGVQGIDDEFLEWFVKNPSCEEVKIESWQTKGEWDLDYKIIIPREEPKTGYVKSETEFLGVEFTLKDGSKQFIPKQETNMSNITANKLIKDWKKTLKSEWIQLDNLDEAKLVFDEEGNVIVENEHGTQFPVSDLSDVELSDDDLSFTDDLVSLLISSDLSLAILDSSSDDSIINFFFGLNSDMQL
jgi:hypothetical protein